jgi:hypothetical protein
MPAFVQTIQIDNPYTRNSLAEVIHVETTDLPDELAVSILHSGRNDIWNLVIKPPNSEAASRKLFGREGDLVPAVFRIRFRELLRMI